MIVAELAARLGLIPNEKEWDKGHELVESLHHAMEAYLGVEGLKKVKEMVDGTVEAAVSAKHLGEQLNISTDAVQELGYAADVTGASAEAMNTAMRRLALGMEHAKKTGSGPLVDALQQLHVPMSKLKGENLEQNLDVLADAFAHAGPNVNKTALAMEIFGRQGAQLLPLLNKGSGGVKALREEAHKLGVVMDKEGVEKAEEFEIAQKRLGATMTGLRNTAVMALLPTLQMMVDSLMEWVQENREAITGALEAAMRGLATAFKVVGSVISWATDLVKEHRETFMLALKAVGVLLTAFAAKAAIDWVIAFAPIAGIVAAIMGLIKIFEMLRDEFGTVTAVVGTLTAALAGAFAIGKVMSYIDKIKDATKAMFGLAEATEAENAAAGAGGLGGAVKKGGGALGALGLGLGVAGAAFVGGQALDKATGFDAEKSWVNPQAMMQGLQAQFSAPPWAQSQAAGSNTTVNGGDLTINVTGMDADQVKELARRESAEHLQDQIRQAHASIGGAPQSMR